MEPVEEYGVLTKHFQLEKHVRRAILAVCEILSPGLTETQVDASFKIWTCVQTCLGWSKGHASLLASARKLLITWIRSFECSCVRCNSVLEVNNKTCVDLCWVAKRWKICVYLRANLISNQIERAQVIASQRKCAQVLDNLRPLASPFGQGFML